MNKLLIVIFCFGWAVTLGQSEEKKSIFTFDITKSILPTLENVGSMDGIPITGITTNYVHYPRLTFGYTRKINESINLGIDIGYGNKSLSLYEKSKDYQLIEFRPEMDYWTGSKKRSYVGLELFYVYNKDVFNTSYYNSGFGLISYDQAYFNRNKFGMMIKTGIYLKLFDSFGLNLFTGIGVQKTNYRYFNVINPRERNSEIEFRHGDKNFRDKDSFVAPEFTLGVKLYFFK